MRLVHTYLFPRTGSRQSPVITSDERLQPCVLQFWVPRSVSYGSEGGDGFQRTTVEKIKPAVRQTSETPTPGSQCSLIELEIPPPELELLMAQELTVS
jgi:hypothetical protein